MGETHSHGSLFHSSFFGFILCVLMLNVKVVWFVLSVSDVFCGCGVGALL